LVANSKLADVMQVPFFRPLIGEDEIEAVVTTLRSGWLTSGPQVKRFEAEFAEAVNARHAVAVNSCTAALHLATEALALERGFGVLVPTMTFAATAEVVRYHGAIPVLVDCDPLTGNMDLEAAERILQGMQQLPDSIPSGLRLAGIIPVHVGGHMVDISAVRQLASRYGLWVIEDAAHAFPAAFRPGPNAPWQRCGEDTSEVSCFSFYANKTITTGEGGMAVTGDSRIAARMRSMSLHGLSRDAWGRYAGGGSWDYKIVAPGFKYNLTDIAAALGIQQLRKAEEMRGMREAVALYYMEAFADLAEISLPLVYTDRIHSWHLFPIRLNLNSLSIDRNSFVDELSSKGVGSSVHWRPLHLHPYYQESFGWRPEDCPVASSEWERLISLPIFPRMRDEEIKYVVDAIKDVCRRCSVTDHKSVNRGTAVKL
jgi:dTDP-4-amino-4,6-dideoxygalactose transaminase